MERVALGMLFLLSGCASLVVEQRAVKLNTEVRAIQTDFSVLSTSFTPEQRAKYARATTAKDGPTFEEFFSSLDTQQQATMLTLLARAQQVEQAQQQLVQEVQQNLTMRHRLRREMPDVSGFIPAGVI